MPRKKFFDILPPKSRELFSEESALSFEEISQKKTTPAEKNRNGKILVSLFILLFFLLVGSYFTLAKVKIEIWPKTEILNFEENITLDINASQIDLSAKVIPAQFLEIEEMTIQEFPSSGEIEKLAEGKIRVYNKYHLPVTLKAETRFQPDNKEVLYFCSPSKISIPAKGFVDTQVRACFVKSGEGEKYNIKPSKFSVPGLSGSELFYYISGESFEPMEGGGKALQVVKEDLEKAKDILTQNLFIKLEESLRKKVLTDLVFLEKGLEKKIIEIIPDVEIGAEVEFFQLQAKGQLRTMVFKKSDLENFAINVISIQIPDNKRIQTESLKIDFSPETIDFEKEEIMLNFQISAKIFSDLEIETLKENLIGKSFRESQIILGDRGDIVKAQISAWPFWLGGLPKDTEKIELEIRVD